MAIVLSPQSAPYRYPETPPHDRRPVALPYHTLVPVPCRHPRATSRWLPLALHLVSAMTADPRDAVIEAARDYDRHQLYMDNCQAPPQERQGRAWKILEEARDEARRKFRDALAALDAADTQARGEKWRHKKRGTTYEMIGTAEVQVTDCILEGHFVVVYRAEDGKLWVRPTEEFYDGRFERIPLPEPAPQEGGEG